MKIILIIFAFFILSCESKPIKLEKPFVIVDKQIGRYFILYEYQDKNGNRKKFDQFQSDLIQYQIGDTLK